MTKIHSSSELSSIASNAGWKISSDVLDCLSDYEKSFFEMEFTGKCNHGYYLNRLKDLGFTAKNRVLDVGCGMGQWSIALAELNVEVQGIDINMERLLIAQHISKQMGLNNLIFRYSPAENIPFESESFDGIFCYGVFMFTRIDKTLQEFHRLLKSGGLLYLNANSLGWYLYLLYERGLKCRNPQIIKSSAKFILNTLFCKKQNIIISPPKLKTLLAKHNFHVMEIGPEGTINIKQSNDNNLEPKYSPYYSGLPMITETISLKR